MTEKPQGYEDEWVVERRDGLGANWRRAPFVWPKDVGALNGAYGWVKYRVVRRGDAAPVQRRA